MVLLFVYIELCLLCLSIFIITENDGTYKINTDIDVDIDTDTYTDTPKCFEN